MREGRVPPIKPLDGEEEEEPDRLRLISTWSVAILAVLGVAAALYLAREPLLPVVTAFVVGVMLSPAAQALEQRKVPRLLSAALMVLLTAILIGVVVTLIASPVADLAGRLPQIGAKLQVFEHAWRRLELSFGVNPANCVAGHSFAQSGMGFHNSRLSDADGHRIDLFPGGAASVHFLVA